MSGAFFSFLDGLFSTSRFPQNYPFFFPANPLFPLFTPMIPRACKTLFNSSYQADFLELPMDSSRVKRELSILHASFLTLFPLLREVL